MEGEQIEWIGTGRWLSFLVAAILVFASIPAVFSHSFGAVAGWSIFLGLLLFGSIASGHAKAPTVAASLSGVLAIRVIVSLFAGSFAGAALELILVIAMFIAWRDLKKQAAEVSPQQMP